MLMLASVGAMSNERAGIAVGPDVAPGASGATGWDIFEGHAFAAGQVVPSGVSLAACLGGCEAGYVSEPVIVGLDGRYEGLRVDPGRLAQDAQLEGDVVTFWMVRGEEREPADQAVLFGGLERVRELHLSFVAAPLLPQEEIQEEVPVEEPAPAASASTRTTTTDLSLPSADELGLVPAGSAQAFAATTLQWGGLPVLPGFAIVLGVLLGAIGVSLLAYRRRLVW